MTPYALDLIPHLVKDDVGTVQVGHGDAQPKEEDELEAEVEAVEGQEAEHNVQPDFQARKESQYHPVSIKKKEIDLI